MDDFLVLGVVRGNQTRRTTWTTRRISSSEVLMGVFWLTSKKDSFDEIGKNEHAHSVRFSRTRFINLAYRPIDFGQHVRRENRREHL